MQLFCICIRKKDACQPHLVKEHIDLSCFLKIYNCRFLQNADNMRIASFVRIC
jgi:hypothetical protein